MSDLSQDLASLRIDRTPPSPSNHGGRRSWLGRAALGAILVVGGLVVWKVLLPTVEASLFKVEVTPTEIIRITPREGSVELTATGYIVAKLSAKVAASVPGRITKVHAREGQAVKSGDLLLEVDVSDQAALSQTLRARAAAASARTETAKAQLGEVELQVARTKPLVESGAVSPSTLEDLTARQRSAKESVRTAEAEARASQADARAAGTALRHGRVFAPIDGTVVGRAPEIGDVLFLGAPPVFELVELSTLLVEVDVPEARLSLSRVGAPTEIVLDALPSERFPGKVEEITPRVNRSKATVVVRVRFDQFPSILFPDMAARVSFLAKPLTAEQTRAPAKTVVPRAAVVDEGGVSYVFVLDGGKVRKQRVTLGPASGDAVEVLDGPPPGTRVVRSPPAGLPDGKAVKEKP